MKRQEAITCLFELKVGLDLPLMQQYEKAIQLGIEALKHLQSCPYFEYQATDELLPGETKD